MSNHIEDAVLEDDNLFGFIVDGKVMATFVCGLGNAEKKAQRLLDEFDAPVVVVQVDLHIHARPDKGIRVIEYQMVPAVVARRVAELGEVTLPRKENSNYVQQQLVAQREREQVNDHE